MDALVRGLMAVLLVLGMTAGLGGCADTGPYAEAKNDWDSVPSADTRHDMRIRLATTQQDH